MIKNIKKLINEIHYSDKFSKHFLGFLDKYRSEVEDKSLFVTFTQVKSDILDKSILANPDTHTDPSGIYAYPLEYVINHPMDIKFGESRKFLQVLRLNTVDVLNLVDISREQCISMLDKIYGNSIHAESAVENRRRRLGADAGAFVYGEIFWHCLTYDLNKPKTFDYEERPSVEQTKILRKLGYKVVIDTSRSVEDAIINSNEPEQAIFLTRDSFLVEDIFINNATERWNTFGKTAEKIMGIVANKTKLPITNKIFRDEDGVAFAKLTDITGYRALESLKFTLGNIQISIFTNLVDDFKHRIYATHDEQEINVHFPDERLEDFTAKPSDTAEHTANEIVKKLNIILK